MTVFDWSVFYPRSIIEGFTIILATILFSFYGMVYLPVTLIVFSYAFWIYATKGQRGYLFFNVMPIKTNIDTGKKEMKVINPLGFDEELTKLYQGIFDTEKVIVNLENSSQYTIHVIKHDDLNIASKLTILARKLGIKSLPSKKGAEAIPVIFFEVWAAGCSALAISKEKDDWGGAVNFKPEALTQNKPRAYIGDTLSGDSIIIDHEIEHGALVAGTSGSGKTEVFVVHHKSMMLCGLSPEVHIIDLKGTPQLRRLKSDSYVSKIKGGSDPDIRGALELLKDINRKLSDRMDKYDRANCDNLWQYRKNHPSERPLVLYMDEIAVLSRAARAADKDDPVKKIMDLVANIAQVGRGAGLIWMAGMQQPLAEDLPTSIRAQLMTRIVLAVDGSSEANVAGIPGAQNQPMQGACMVRHGKKIQIGRAAYIPGGE